MAKFKTISIREKEELEPYLIASPDLIEEGLKVLDHQHPTDSGPLDILAIDPDGTLVVIELKNEAVEGHLDQGLRYYDWCRQNVPWIAHAYNGKAQFNLGSPPRLILIAPSFTDNVRRIAKYIGIELKLVEYHAFEDEKGGRGLICRAIDYGQPPIPPEIPTIEKKLEYMQSDSLKKLFSSVLDELRGKDVEIKPRRDLWISFYYRGKCFMYMAPKRAFFVIEVLAPDGNWCDRIRVETRKDWDNAFQRHISKYMEYLDKNT